MAELGIAVPEPAGATARQESVLWVAVDGRMVGMLSLDDAIRPEARPALEELAATGMRRIVLATGDRPSAAERVAHQDLRSRWMPCPC
jgi:cation-transporting P-type ATPase C